MSNAIKFTYEGEVNLNIEQSFLNNEGLEELKFNVKDTGIGIKDDARDRIFNEFEQEDNEHTRNEEGTGLGLSICRDFVHLFNGELTLVSELGVGSEFSFTIMTETLAKEEEERVVLSEKRNIEDFRTDLGLDVLLVEDKKVNQMVAKVILEKFGCSVDVAEDGVVAVDKSSQKVYDLILMDIRMPNMDGLEATIEIKKAGIKTPIIGLSANALDGDADHYIAKGMDDYLSKPINKDRLYDVLYQIEDKSFISKHM